jgi:hypothetical protein
LDWIELVVSVDVVREVALIELTVRVDPVSVVKYPDVVDNVGTRIDDRTVNEEVI